uniref:Uncharacterized protein n=1 Tax=Nelumbo nucifera TaxID=4432 RepID=A0A822YTW0_NELNU|nr:TPA_asm: hypothetical protein HUJ06_005621 [Nelumbo nucifera]
MLTEIHCFGLCPHLKTSFSAYLNVNSEHVQSQSKKLKKKSEHVQILKAEYMEYEELCFYLNKVAVIVISGAVIPWGLDYKGRQNAICYVCLNTNTRDIPSKGH